MPRLTGERPIVGCTPDSILAIHEAGYREVDERAGCGLVADLGCGVGGGAARLSRPGRRVVGIDYAPAALAEARRRLPAGTGLACMDAARLGLRAGAFDAVCSSHLIEHFEEPDLHVAEVARVLAPGGTAFFLTPNAPADFENPFHVHLFEPDQLEAALGRHFAEVSVAGLEASERARRDLEARRARARRMLALDVLRIRRHLPRSWYVAAYSVLLPLAYRLAARSGTGGASGITASDFFVTDEIAPTTPVLLGIGRRPRPAGPGLGR